MAGGFAMLSLLATAVPQCNVQKIQKFPTATAWAPEECRQLAAVSHVYHQARRLASYDFVPQVADRYAIVQVYQGCRLRQAWIAAPSQCRAPFEAAFIEIVRDMPTPARQMNLPFNCCDLLLETPDQIVCQEMFAADSPIFTF